MSLIFTNDSTTDKTIAEENCSRWQAFVSICDQCLKLSRLWHITKSLNGKLKPILNYVLTFNGSQISSESEVAEQVFYVDINF